MWDFGILLAREMKLKESSTGSAFGAYLDTLPSVCPCIWCATASELDEFIYGSPIGNLAAVLFKTCIGLKII